MPNNKYILGAHDRHHYDRTWVLHYLPGVAKPKAAEMYTELFRFKNGYYRDEVERARKISVDLREDYAYKHLERMGYSTHQNVAYVKKPTGVMCIEIKVSNAVDYLARQSIKQKKDFGMQDLRSDMAEDPRVIAACVNATWDGMLVMFRIDPALRVESHQAVVFQLSNMYNVKVVSSDHTHASFFVTYDPDMFIRKWREVKVMEPFPTIVRKKRWEMSQWQDGVRIKRDSFEEALRRETMLDVKHRGKWGFFIPNIESPTADKRLKRNYKYSKRNKNLQ